MALETYKHTEITGKIIGCAMKVHSSLGNGFQEVIYHRALEIEFKKQNISYLREMEMNIFYENEIIGKRRVDFFVEGKIMVELKAVSILDNTYLNQAINHLEAYKMEIGLLINFGANSLEFKRLTNQRKLEK